jgi:two-component system nitrate/nitrite response regulator NarL
MGVVPRPTDGRDDGGFRRRGGTRLVILTEVRFYREGLARFFTSRGGFELVGTAGHVADVVEIARHARFDVVLVDMATAGTPEAIRVIRACVPAVGIVAIGVREEEHEVIALAEAGAFGFMSRDASLEELSAGVQSAARNESPCSARVAAMLARRITMLAEQLPADRGGIPLTRRQLEVVELIGEGLPNKAIAQRLFIEVPTVKNHVHNILARLGVHHREEAASAVRRLSTRPMPR